MLGTKNSRMGAALGWAEAVRGRGEALSWFIMLCSKDQESLLLRGGRGELQRDMQLGRGDREAHVGGHELGRSPRPTYIGPQPPA